MEIGPENKKELLIYGLYGLGRVFIESIGHDVCTGFYPDGR